MVLITLTPSHSLVDALPLGEPSPLSCLLKARLPSGQAQALLAL